MICRLIGKKSTSPYSLRGETVKAEDEEQDLGIIVAQTLKLSRQCVAAAKSANKTLYDQSYIC